MAPWWLRHVLREILAGLGVLLVLIGLILLYRWMSATRPQDDRLVEGQIVGFHGYLVKAEFRNVVFATVRLPEGRIANVAMPSSGRAAHCRKGDRVKLVRSGVRLRVAGGGCARLNPRPASVRALPPEPPAGSTAPAPAEPRPAGR